MNQVSQISHEIFLERHCDGALMIPPWTFCDVFGEAILIFLVKRFRIFLFSLPFAIGQRPCLKGHLVLQGAPLGWALLGCAPLGWDPLGWAPLGWAPLGWAPLG